MYLTVRIVFFSRLNYEKINQILELALGRFERYIVPILTNVFSKMLNTDIVEQWSTNISVPRRSSMRDRIVCPRLFSANKSFHQPFLKHSYPDLYK